MSVEEPPVESPRALVWNPHERPEAVPGTASLNLARRPFINSRPVTRAAVLLWALGVVLLASNVSLFWSYLSGSQEKRRELAEIGTRIDEERQAQVHLEGQIGALNLEKQNRQVSYLNQKISERTFSWSVLLDNLAKVLPDGVRLLRLAPQGIADREPRRSGAVVVRDTKGTAPVTLQITGEAKSSEALLQFVDNLFAHPVFADPDLARESRDKDDREQFELKVKYRPAGIPAHSPVIVEAPARRTGAPPRRRARP